MAVRSPRSDGPDLSQTRPNRSSSFSSDVMSTSAKSASTAYHLPPANPAPAYIARSEASELVSTELDRQVDISPPALTLLNEFLDHVLYSLISTSHSVALGHLKAAVPAVLKPRLGKAALRFAEEELREYMEDEEAEDLNANRHSIQSKTYFDVELVWKLARLRCMVYTRMGDLEEEDEGEWLEKERLLEQVSALSADARQFVAVSPGAAIFLTGVIEYLGEQALYYAAQYAQKRHDNAQNQLAASHAPDTQFDSRHSEIVLDGKDMNHVGRDSPLSRLWRSWRRNTRSPGQSHSRPTSPDAMLSPAPDSIHSRTTSGSHQGILPILEENMLSREVLRSATPSRIPLPMSDNDVAEIEGYDFVTSENASRRPVSMPSMPAKFPPLEITTDMQTQDVPTFQERSPLRPSFSRNRSNSLPSTQTPFYMSSIITNGDPGSPIEARRESVIETIPEEAEIVKPDLTNGVHHDATEELQLGDATLNKQEDAPVNEPAISSESAVTNAGVIAGIVGVHHVGRTAQPSETDPAATLAQHRPDAADDPLMSASIRGPGDFDMMYVPEGRLSPSEQQQKAQLGNIASAETVQKRDPYHEIKMRQYEEHKRYSQHSHEMDTPSIYSHRDHSPRFPQDMRPSSSPTYEVEKQVPSYAPTPEPDDSDIAKIYAPTMPNTAAAGIVPQLVSRYSPVSQASSKAITKHVPVSTESIPEPVPELPQIPQAVADERTAGRARGHSKSSSSSSRLLGFTRDASGRPQTIHQQNAAGGMTDEARQAYSSAPSNNLKSRPDTATSTKTSRRQHLRIRADSDNNTATNVYSGEIAKRSLEEMIHSDETLHYTLTPATANFRDNAMKPPLVLTQTHDVPEIPRSNALAQENATPKPMTRSRKVSMEAGKAPQIVTRSRKVSMEAGRAPQVVPGEAPQVVPDEEERKVIPSSKNIPQQPASPTRTRNPIGVPRDPKVDRMSGVRDLADYVRSTGPSNDDQLPKALSIRPTSPNVSRATVPTSPSSPMRVQPPSPQSPRRTKTKLQARDPRPSRNAESSALIDFIREGPPRDSGDHRINRQVAPFRTTMDSDDINGLMSSAPKQSEETNGVPSIATTTNSHTPLVKSEVTMGSAVQARAGNAPDPSKGIPKRTQRKVRDPYSLDDIDDDLLDEPKQRTATEESLIDFLRNTAPPQSMVAQPILSTPPDSQDKDTLSNRRPSADKLKGFGRKDRVPSTPTSQSQPQARAESPHLTQSGSKLDSYRPTQATHAAHVDRNRANKSRNEARSATGQSQKGYGDTADLAEYFRNTGPPPAATEVKPFILSNPQINGVKQQQQQDSGGGLKKFFSMRGRK